MNRQQKIQAVEDISRIASESSAIFVTQYHGLTVGNIDDLRRRMRKANASFKVVKNSLAKIAVKGGEFSELDAYLSGPTAIAYSDDPVTSAKVLVAFSKEFENFKIVGGVVDRQLADSKVIRHIATLPTLNEIRSKIISCIQAPARNIACILQAPAGQVARVISAHAENK